MTFSSAGPLLALTPTEPVRPLLFLAALLLAGCAQATSVRKPAPNSGDAASAAEALESPDRLREDFTDEQLIALLSQIGYEARTVLEGSITFELEHAQVMLFNQWGGDLQLYYVVTGGSWDLPGINDWNRTRRLCRAYVDPDGDLVLESDLLALGGVTDRQVVSFVAIFEKAVEMFIEEVASGGVPRPHEPTAPPPDEGGTWH